MILCIFNPEHDLCLANGGLNFMPPRSALQFAEKSAHLMQILYGKESIGICATQANKTFLAHSDIQQIVAWGWNRTLKNQLLKQDIPNELLPTDKEVEIIRQLSHRTTSMPIANELNIQSQVRAVSSLNEIDAILKECKNIVLKAPWSGSGRGLRWVTEHLTLQDENWARKIISEQRCVMVEHRHQVVQNFALEYWIGNSVEFIGYSLFEVLNGVYRGNRLWPDDRIEHYLSQYISLHKLHQVELRLCKLFTHHFVGKYRGPLGVDMIIAQNKEGYYLVSVVEINFRHTMGHVAHALSLVSREGQDDLWSPEL